MPAENFSNIVIEHSVYPTGETQLQIKNAKFYEGFQEVKNLFLEIDFIGFPTNKITLLFANRNIVTEIYTNKYLLFNDTKGQIYPIPPNCKSIKLRTNKDYQSKFEFLLTFNILPITKIDTDF